jgi:hypothetical protein
LVYWTHDYIDSGFSYEKCIVNRIDKGDNVEMFLSKIYSAVNEFRSKKFYNPDISKLDGTKCASCVYCRYSGHKNGKRNKITLPYQKNYDNLYRAEYPD